MRSIKEQKCPACGAPLRFDPASGKLVCDYCGTVTDLDRPQAQSPDRPEEGPADQTAQGQAGSAGYGEGQTAQGQAGSAGSGEGQSAPGQAGSAGSGGDQSAAAGDKPRKDTIEGFDFQHMTDAVSVPDAENLPVYNCVSCGAEVIAPAEQAALTCPYCGNNIVLTDKISGRLRPDGVIPFRIQAKDLPDAVNRFYRDKKLLPRRFFSESTMGRVTGVYVPFWVFRGRVEGRFTYGADSSVSIRNGNYIITTTDHYRLVRDAALDFDDLPVDASGRIEDRLMDSLEPFDSAETKPFDMRYLAGFTADRFDQKKSDISNRAQTRMMTSTATLVDRQATAGYLNAYRKHTDLRPSVDAKYILFPVYLFDISHAGKNYHFAVNGQTGKVVGDLPTDPGTSLIYFLKRFGLVSGALIALSVIRYMMGM